MTKKKVARKKGSPSAKSSPRAESRSAKAARLAKNARARERRAEAKREAERLARKRSRAAKKGAATKAQKRETKRIRGHLVDFATEALMKAGLHGLEMQAHAMANMMTPKQWRLIMQNPTARNVRKLAADPKQINENGVNPFWYHNIQATIKSLNLMLKLGMQRLPRK